MDVYIKPSKKAAVIGRKVVYLRDMAEIFSPSGKQKELEDTVILKIKGDKSDSYLVTIMDIIKAVNNSVPEANITNLGETDTVIEYMEKKKQRIKAVDFFKIVFISLSVFFGAATAIMSFHSDAQIPKVFENYYFIFFGENPVRPDILTIPYSIGVAAGIIVFFNHFSKAYITKDPTPIEVQMSTYEKETTDSIIDTLSRKKEMKKQEKTK